MDERLMPSAHPGLLEVPFLPGIRQDVDPHTAPLGTLVDAENVRFRRLGAVQPRPGTRKVTAASAEIQITDAETQVGFVGSRGQNPVLGIDGKVLQWGEDQFAFAGAYPTAMPRRRRNGLISEVNTGYGRPGYRCAIAAFGDTVLIAASDTVNVHYRVEAIDGRVLGRGSFTGTVCTAVVALAPVAIGGTAYYLIVQNGTDLTAYPIYAQDRAAIGVGISASVGTLSASSAHWDASSYDGTSWFLVYQETATNLRIRRMVETGSVDTTAVSVLTGTAVLSVWADTVNDLVWVGIYNDPSGVGTVAYRVHSAVNASTVLNNQTITTGLLRGPPLFGPHPTANTAFFVFRLSNTSSPYTVATYKGTANSAGTVALSGTPTWHVLPLTKPDAQRRVWCETSDNLASSSTLLDRGFRTTRVVLLRFWETGAGGGAPPVLELATEPTENRSSGASANEFHAVASVSDRHYVIAPRLLRFGTDGLLFRADVLEYETADQNPYRGFVDLAQSAVVSGGQPVELFGITAPVINTVASAMSGCVEIGFALEPALLGATAAVGSGGLTSSATYQWLFVFEWIDMYGRRHRSAASSVWRQSLGASENEVAFTISALDWSQRLNVAPGTEPPSVVLHAYRTEANRTTPYRRATPTSGAPIAYSFSSGVITWTDRISDTNLRTQEIVYIDGGVLDNVLAPSARYVAASDERTLLGGLWDRSIVQFSKIRVPGEPEQFADSPAFQVPLKGECTGVAYQDGSWLAFTDRTIAVITGDGPNDQGTGDFFVRTIVTDRGHVDGAPLLETALGVIYRSRRGLELVPRGNGLPVFIGKEVQGLTREFPLVLAACNHVSDLERLALFLVSDGVEQAVLVLDLDLTQELGRGVWSSDTHAMLGTGMQALGAWPTGAFIASADINATDNLAGCVYETSPTFETDLSNTEGLASTVETALIRPAGLVGVWRCCTVNTLFTNCDGGTAQLFVTTEQVDTKSWTLPNTPTAAVYRTFAPSIVVCTAAKVRISITRTGTQTGPNMHGVSIERQPLDGARRTASGER